MLDYYHTLYFETTRNCNFDCPYCSTGSTNKKQFPDLPFDVIKNRILIPAYNLGTRRIDFSGGEFLLRKDAFDLLELAHKMGYKIAIASNGSTLTDNTLKKIKSIVGDNIIISLGINSFDDLNKKTRTVETQYALDRLEKLKHYDISTNISITLSQWNKSTFSETVKNVAKFSLPFNRIPFVPRSCNRYDLMFDKAALRDYFHPVLHKYWNGQVSYIPYLLPQETYEKVSGQDLNKEKVPLNPSVGCWVGAYYGINPEGEVSPCPMLLDHVTGGNVLDTPLKDILFKSDLFTKIVQRDKLKGKCGTCKYKYTCGGCRVMAYYLTGDVYAEDPTCFIDELSEEQIQRIEQTTENSFKNYVRMAKFGNIFSKK
ncbi:MAG: radical SAM protein [Bacteroidota bacterium]